MNHEDRSKRPADELMDELERRALHFFGPRDAGPEHRWGFTFSPDWGEDLETRYRVALFFEPSYGPELKFPDAKSELECLEAQEKKAVLNYHRAGRCVIREGFGETRAEAVRNLWRLIFEGVDL
jgi:hypothetical protein